MNLSIMRAKSPELIADVRGHCEYFHYLHRYPDPRSLPFAYVLVVDGQPRRANNLLWGLVVFKKLQHDKQAGLFGYEGLPTAWQVLDMARVWVSPKLQGRLFNGHSKAVFSQMVSMAIKRVQWDWLEHHPPRFPDLPYHITRIVSYCELEHHDGTAYRASGFERFGLTQDGAKEIYVRRLHAPRKRWQVTTPVQQPLLDGMPLVHRKVQS